MSNWSLTKEEWDEHKEEHRLLLNNAEEMASILRAWNDAGGFFNVIRSIGRIIKWAAALTTAIGVLYAASKGWIGGWLK